MKKTFIAAAMVGIAASPMAVAHADSSATITLNGQNISPNGPVRCYVDPTFLNVVQVGHDIGSAFVQVGSDDPTKVSKVQITDTNTVMYDFEPAQFQSGLDRGDSQVTKRGKTYQITGHIPPVYDTRAQKSVHNAPLVPFEIDATCP
jgi:hypothetical protein